MEPGPIRPDVAPPAVKPRRRRFGVLVVVLLLALLVALHPWWLPPAGAFLDISTPPRPVDDVLVLGGGASTRPFVAAELYKAGLVHRVLVPTVKAAPDGEDGLVPSDHELMRRVLLARGVPAAVIVLLPGEVDSTADEARSLKRYLAENPGRTVAVVTNNFHTRRARRIFRSELDGAADLPFFAAPTDGFDANDWWRSEAGCTTYADEYLKLLGNVVGR